MKQGSGMGISPVVVVAFLVAAAVCFGGAAAGGRPTGGRTGTDIADAIRLPSSAGAGGAVGRPWECCDWVTQDPVFRPARWRCNDVVEECSPDCRDCEASVSVVDGRDGFACRDWVVSLLQPPVCTPRPWGDCCDLAACTRSYIPYCRCTDEVESCSSNCKECELVDEEADPPLYRCLDVFHGYPGPTCTPFVSKSN